MSVLPAVTAPRSWSERPCVTVGPHERAILSLLLVDPGAFSTAEEIAKHTELSVEEIKAVIGHLLILGWVNWACVVTDAGREALGEGTP